MTQKARVLSMLRAAGSRGVRSDAFLDAHIPRVAARVLELKEEGFDVSSEREGKFCRYTLESVGIDAGCLSASTAGESQTACVDSSRSVPACFDADADWAA